MLHFLRRDAGFYKRLLFLTAPFILQNLINFSVGLADTFMVSQLGNQAIAAVTAANAPVFLMISLCFGMQNGLSVLISQYWGKRDLVSINRALGVAVMAGFVISGTLALIFFSFPVQIMDLLSNDHSLSLLGAPYLRIIGFSYVLNTLSAVYVSTQGSTENPHFGMKLFASSALLNVGLNYLLIFGNFGLPRLEIAGAAVATLLTRSVEFLICVIYALRSRRIPLQFAHLLRPGAEMARRFARYTSPVVLNEIVWGLGNSALTVIYGHTENSVEMLAANALMGNLGRLSLVACFGLGAATAVLIGKSIGEGRSHEDVMDLARTLLSFTTMIGLGIAAVTLILLPTLLIPVVFPLFKLYGTAASVATAMAVAQFGTSPLHAFCITSILGVLRAGGDVAFATMLDIGPQWLVSIPVTALVALVFRLGWWPICLAVQTENLVKLPLCLLRIRSGKWIHDVTRSGGKGGGA